MRRRKSGALEMVSRAVTGKAEFAGQGLVRCTARLSRRAMHLTGEYRSGSQNPKVETYFAFFAFSALIFAHRAFAARDILARTEADMVLAPFAPFGLLVRPGDTAVLAPPFRTAIAS